MSSTSAIHLAADLVTISQQFKACQNGRNPIEVRSVLLVKGVAGNCGCYKRLDSTFMLLVGFWAACLLPYSCGIGSRCDEAQPRWSILVTAPAARSARPRLPGAAHRSGIVCRQPGLWNQRFAGLRRRAADQRRADGLLLCLAVQGAALHRRSDQGHAGRDTRLECPHEVLPAL